MKVSTMASHRNIC